MSTLRQLTEQKIESSNLGFKEVKGAADLSAILASRISTPSCYLFRMRNNPEKNISVQETIQDVEQTIALIVITQNVRTAKGADSSDENEAYCDLIQQQLLGWQPSTEHEPYQYAGGSLISFKGGFFIWQELYKTSKTICN